MFHVKREMWITFIKIHKVIHKVVDKLVDKFQRRVDKCQKTIYIVDKNRTPQYELLTTQTYKCG